MLELVLRIISIIFPVFACAGVGLLYGRYHRPDMSVINKLNMEVFVPILMFWVIAEKPFDFAKYADLTLAGIIVILGSGLILWPLVHVLKINARTFLPPMMFNNSGNMGLPLLLFAFGEDVLQAAVVLFLVEMVLHFTVGLYILDHKTKPWVLLKMPMIQATALGFIFSIFAIPIPEMIAHTIELLSQIAIPLLLFALGVRLLDVDFSDWRLGLFGAAAAPLSGVACALIAQYFLQLDNMQFVLLMVFAALPPAVLNVLVAEQYNQEPQRVASIVLIGNIASLIFIPITLWFTLPLI